MDLQNNTYELTLQSLAPSDLSQVSDEMAGVLPSIVLKACGILCWLQASASVILHLHIQIVYPSYLHRRESFKQHHTKKKVGFPSFDKNFVSSFTQQICKEHASDVLGEWFLGEKMMYLWCLSISGVNILSTPISPTNRTSLDTELGKDACN